MINEVKIERQQIEDMLMETSDFYVYLNLLKIMLPNYLIILSVKDTPGNMLNSEMLKKIHDMGFCGFTKDLWRMYIGVSNKGNIVCDAVSKEREERVDYDGCLQKVNIFVSSEAWRKGNSCKIIVDNEDFAVNKRGINLVVYDIDNHRLVDSVCYDAHDSEQGVFSRKKSSWTKKYYDVAVVGVWFGANYGSLINGYAIYKLLKDMGLSVLMVNKPNVLETDGELQNPHCKKFIEKFYEKSEISAPLPYARLPELNKCCDIFLAGSDQIWHYNIIKAFQYTTLLNFVDDSKKRISFGTSFGHQQDFTPDDEKIKVRELLRKFNCISVREQASAEILSSIYGVKSTVTIDPVFCLEFSDYKQIGACSEIQESEPYIFTYILDPTPEIIYAIEYYSNISGMKIINMFDGNPVQHKKSKEMFRLPNILEEVGAEDLINLCLNAAFVITDSFHGTCFAIILNKPFLSITNFRRGAARFQELKDKFGLSERFSQNSQMIPHDVSLMKAFDYTEINRMIARDKQEAVEWLKKAIEAPKEQLPSIVIPESRVADLLYKNPEFVKIRLLATLLRDYGVKHIVLSPGGRDVPLVRMFEYNEDSFILHRVTDERSAAYYGMGIAAQLQKPVACVCTSGTAASNYLPAVTEAYYTGIPLIVITADRPQVYLNHGEDQTIPQEHIYANVVKREITVPEGVGYKAEYQTRRDISECILETMHNGFGPVHINIAITDINIGAKVPKEYWKLLPRIMPHILRVGIGDGETEMLRWVNALKKSTRILVVYGQNPPPSEKQLKNIEKFASKYNCVIVTDFISNLDCAYSLQPYNMLRAISNDEFNRQLSPDILITVGGKRLMNDPLTFKVRSGLKNIRHWSVIPSGKIKDFYFRLTSVLEMSQDFFFEWFSVQAGDIINNGVYYNKWKEMTEKYLEPKVTQFDSHYIQSKFIPIVPENSLLHLGVGQSFVDSRRYSVKRSVEVFCNMGTNGIDGCTSTFMGQCSVIKDRKCFLLVGDLSFFYDMNSIWNKKLDRNVRILMVNNNGSGLLRGNNLKAVTAAHNTSARGWVESVNFEYMSASTKEGFDEKLKYFLGDEPKAAVFFEVFCD